MVRNERILCVIVDITSYFTPVLISFRYFFPLLFFVSTPLSVGFSYAKVQRSSGIKHRRANGSWIARKPSQIRDVLSVPRHALPVGLGIP